MESEKNDELWKIAQERVKFKQHLVTYILCNLFFVGLWFFANDNNDDYNGFWPIWPMLGWGFGLAMHYFRAYQTLNFFSTEKEYEKIKNKTEK